MQSAEFKEPKQIVEYCPVHEAARAGQIIAEGKKPLPVTCSNCLKMVQGLGQPTEDEKQRIDKA